MLRMPNLAPRRKCAISSADLHRHYSVEVKNQHWMRNLLAAPIENKLGIVVDALFHVGTSQRNIMHTYIDFRQVRRAVGSRAAATIASRISDRQWALLVIRVMVFA